MSTPRTRFIDSHVHFWDPSRLVYPWLVQAGELKRAFLPAQFAPFHAEQLQGVVFVEANCDPGQSLQEVAFVEALCRVEPRIAGIVAYAGFSGTGHDGTLLEQLRRHPLVVGVRHNIQGHAPGYCTQPAFVNFVRALAALRLPFDICATATQLPDVLRLADSCPDTQFVLDHCGKPAIRDGAIDDWAAAIARLSEHPNVSCKMSGLLTESAPAQRNAQTLAPWFAAVQDAFGPERMLYGSDWPVVTASGGEQLWFAMAQGWTSGWSDVDREKFFFGNATRFYGLHT